MLYANPAYGNNGLVDGAGPVGIYSAIDDEPPDTGADGQPLYAAVDYGGVGDSNQQQETNNQDDATYELPGRHEPRRPPPWQRPDQDADGETYETIENPYRQKQLDTAAPGSKLDVLGGFQQEVYADLLGEQKLYGKEFDAEDAHLVPGACTEETYLVPMAGASATNREDLAPPAPRRPSVASSQQEVIPLPAGYSELWKAPECSYAIAAADDGESTANGSLDAISGSKKRSESGEGLYVGFASAEPAPTEEDAGPCMRLGMSRTDADAFLLDKSEGAFVVRASSKANSFAISVAVDATKKKKNAAFHQIIQVKGMSSASPTYRVQRGAAGPFESIAALIEHYSTHLAVDDIPVLLSTDHRAWGGDAAPAAIDTHALYGNAIFGFQHSEA